MSLDGVIAGPDDAMDWVFSYERPTPAGEEVIETTSAILAGGEGSPACRCWWHWTEQALPPAVGASHQHVFADATVTRRKRSSLGGAGATPFELGGRGPCTRATEYVGSRRDRGLFGLRHTGPPSWPGPSSAAARDDRPAPDHVIHGVRRSGVPGQLRHRGRPVLSRAGPAAALRTSPLPSSSRSPTAMDAALAGPVLCPDVWPYRLSEAELTAYLHDARAVLFRRTVPCPRWLEPACLRAGTRGHAPASKLVGAAAPNRNRRTDAGAQGEWCGARRWGRRS